MKKRVMLLAAILVLMTPVFYFAYPGPVYWVDLYWTLMIDHGFVKPGEDAYPWTVAVDWAPDNSSIATGGYHPDVLVWEPMAGKLITRLKGHKTWVQEVIYSSDGKYIASADWDGRVLLWDTGKWTLEREFVSSGDIFTVAFHPSQPLIASGSYNGIVTVFDLNTGETKTSFSSNPGGTMNITFTGDGSFLAAAGEDGRINLFDTEAFKTAGTLTGHEQGITSLSFSGKGEKLLSCGDDGTIRLWDFAQKRLLITWKASMDWVNFCAFVPDTERFLSANSEGDIALWNRSSPSGTMLVRHEDWAQCVRPSKDGRYFASVGKRGHINIWDLEKNVLVTQMNVEDVISLNQ